ncbi:Uncharacterised protein [Achromobacter xylosoxidans]|nr:Uncharacterised protein [Achromobacter xylosoxidans]CUJ28646.1 Uncharacterised protein [Achromobacter xylosoxidans]
MRHTTERVVLMISRPGSADSAAATVTISAPMKANITPSRATTTDFGPLGMKPWLVRWLHPLASPHGHRCASARLPMTRNSTMATTLTSANQNSNSP